MSEKAYLKILQGGLLASFLILFFVFSSLLFPFITSKQLIFNILMEVLLIVWLVFIIKFPAYRPKKSYLTWGLVAYFISIALSLVVSVDFNLSFWGDAERMLGFFHLFHFLIFYLIAVSVFRSKADFHLLLKTVIISSLVVAVYGLAKNQMNSTIGNCAYVAAMMLFAIFLEVYFLLREKNWWLKSVYLLSLLISLVALFKADISGSQAGLVAGLVVGALTLILLSKSRKNKIIASSALALFLGALVLLFAFRFNPVFDETYLGKALRDFSTQNITLNTRLISYQAAGQYLIDNPITLIFGVGHGNYAKIFDQYFNPDFYNFDRSATYFDRAHNTLIDIITTTGIIGLLAYLSIFFFVVSYLIRAYKSNQARGGDIGLSGNELAVFLALITAYFVQNLAVFDSFATYLYFMALLSFINFVGLKEEASNNSSFSARKLLSYVVLPLAVIFSLASLLNNINAFKMLQDTIKAYVSSHSYGLMAGAKEYEQVFKYRTGLERDARESYINLIIESSDQILQNSSGEFESALLLAQSAAEANRNYNPGDNLILSRLAKVYSLIGNFYFRQNDRDKGSYYANLALDAIDRAIEASPGRPPLYLVKSNLLFNFGQNQEALEMAEYAKNLNNNIPEAYCQLANMEFILDNQTDFLNNLKSCQEKGGLLLSGWQSFLNSVESHYYEQKDYQNLIDFYHIILAAQENEEGLVSLLSNLAVVYLEAGDWEAARDTARQIASVNEIYATDVDTFLQAVNQAQYENTSSQ